jgi:hypothetical protein
MTQVINSNNKMEMKMKFTYLSMFIIYFILSFSFLSTTEQQTFALTGTVHYGGDMSSESGIFCLTYNGNIVTTTVTLVEQVNNAGYIRYETKKFLNDGQPHQDCWQKHDSFGKLFHFIYKINCTPL